MARRTSSLSAVTETRSGEVAREIGRLLREARQARGEDLATAAGELYIQPAYLEALELGEFARIPAGVYHAGFLRSYAKHLGLDGRALVERLTTPTGSKAGVASRGLNRADASGQRRFLTKTAALVLLVTALGGAGYYAASHATRDVDQLLQAAGQAEVPPPAAPPAGGEREIATAEPLHTNDSSATPTGRETDIVAVQPAGGSNISQRSVLDTLASAPAIPEAASPPEVWQGGSAMPEGSAHLAALDASSPIEPPGVGFVPPEETAALSEVSEGEAAAPAEPTPPRGQFAIHVASVRTVAEATAEWLRLAKRHPSLAGLELGTPKPVDIPGKGTFYRVIGGAFATRAAAQAACGRLEAQGRDCRPVRR